MLKRRFTIIGLLIVLMGLPFAPVFADGDHGPGGDHSEDASSGGANPLVIGIGVAVVIAGGLHAIRKEDENSLPSIAAGLTVATGVIHLMLGLSGDTLLLLNGLGYLALTALIFFPINIPPAARRILPVVLIVYTLVTIVGYFLLHTPAHYSTVGIVNKVIEAALVIVLGAVIGQRSTT